MHVYINMLCNLRRPIGRMQVALGASSAIYCVRYARMHRRNAASGLFQLDCVRLCLREIHCGSQSCNATLHCTKLTSSSAHWPSNIFRGAGYIYGRLLFKRRYDIYISLDAHMTDNSLSLHIVTAMDRSLVVDTLPAEEQVKSTAWSTRMSAIGHSLGPYMCVSLLS